MGKNFIKVQFDNPGDLNRWLDNCCMRCAMANRGGRDRCETCKVNRQYKTAAQEMGMEVDDEDDD